MTAAWGQVLMRVSWFGVQVRVQCVILQDDCGVQEGDLFRGGLRSEFDGTIYANLFMANLQ